MAATSDESSDLSQNENALHIVYPSGEISVFEQAALEAGRICTSCCSTKTPLWRNGPLGSKTLCNACGIKFKQNKMELIVDPRRPSKRPFFQLTERGLQHHHSNHSHNHSHSHSSHQQKPAKVREKQHRASAAVAPATGTKSRERTERGGSDYTAPMYRGALVTIDDVARNYNPAKSFGYLPFDKYLVQEKAGRANTFGKEDLRLFKSMMAPSPVIATDANSGRQRR